MHSPALVVAGAVACYFANRQDRGPPPPPTYPVAGRIAVAGGQVPITGGLIEFRPDKPNGLEYRLAPSSPTARFNAHDPGPPPRRKGPAGRLVPRHHPARGRQSMPRPVAVASVCTITAGKNEVTVTVEPPER